jgi:hypothetical protein
LKSGKQEIKKKEQRQAIFFVGDSPKNSGQIFFPISIGSWDGNSLFNWLMEKALQPATKE